MISVPAHYFSYDCLGKKKNPEFLNVLVLNRGKLDSLLSLRAVWHVLFVCKLFPKCHQSFLGAAACQKRNFSRLAMFTRVIIDSLLKESIFCYVYIASCCKSCYFLACCWTLLQQFQKCYNLSWVVVYVSLQHNVVKQPGQGRSFFGYEERTHK